MTTATDTPAVRATGRHVFARVVAGVDGSAEALEAVRQAALLTTGDLTLLAAWDVAPPVIGAIGAAGMYPLDEQTPRHEAEQALEAAAEQAAGPRTTVVRGLAWQQLIEE